MGLAYALWLQKLLYDLIFSLQDESSVHREVEPLVVAHQAEHEYAMRYGLMDHSRQVMTLFADTVSVAFGSGRASSLAG